MQDRQVAFTAVNYCTYLPPKAESSQASWMDVGKARDSATIREGIIGRSGACRAAGYERARTGVPRAHFLHPNYPQFPLRCQSVRVQLESVLFANPSHQIVTRGKTFVSEESQRVREVHPRNRDCAVKRDPSTQKPVILVTFTRRPGRGGGGGGRGGDVEEGRHYRRRNCCCHCSLSIHLQQK